jgi:hypothetical protein
MAQCKFKDCEEEAGSGSITIGPGYIGFLDYLATSVDAPMCDFHLGLLKQFHSHVAAKPAK